MNCTCYDSYLCIYMIFFYLKKIYASEIVVLNLEEQDLLKSPLSVVLTRVIFDNAEVNND